MLFPYSFISVILTLHMFSNTMFEITKRWLLCIFGFQNVFESVLNKFLWDELWYIVIALANDEWEQRT